MIKITICDVMVMVGPVHEVDMKLLSLLVIKLLSRLATPDAIKERLSSIIGLLGVMLALLVSAITSIDITKYQGIEPWLNYAFLASVCCFLLSMLIGLIASFKINSL